MKEKAPVFRYNSDEYLYRNAVPKERVCGGFMTLSVSIYVCDNNAEKLESVEKKDAEIIPIDIREMLVYEIAGEQAKYYDSCISHQIAKTDDLCYYGIITYEQIVRDAIKEIKEYIRDHEGQYVATDLYFRFNDFYDNILTFKINRNILSLFDEGEDGITRTYFTVPRSISNYNTIEIPPEKVAKEREMEHRDALTFKRPENATADIDARVYSGHYYSDDEASQRLRDLSASYEEARYLKSGKLPDTFVPQHIPNAQEICRQAGLQASVLENSNININVGPDTNSYGEDYIESVMQTLSRSERQVFDPSLITIKKGYSNAQEILRNLVGLANVKEDIQKLQARLAYNVKQASRGIDTGSSSMHMCFLGSPGTGKTTVARIITGILYDMGYIKENKTVEVNAQNFKAGYVGQTAVVTKAILKMAQNGVLFIDEAYGLYDGYQKGYGAEAVAVILKEMEDNRDNTTVIFAGYDEPMQNFLTMNPGLRSRINKYFHFNNYDAVEVCEIARTMASKRNLRFSAPAMLKLFWFTKLMRHSATFSNARFARNVLEKMELEHAYNTRNETNSAVLNILTDKDLSDDAINEIWKTLGGKVY